MSLKKNFPIVFCACVVCFMQVTFAQEAATLVVYPEHPLKATDTLLRKAILRWSGNIIKPNKLFNPHPSSFYFPGAPKLGFKTEELTFHLLHRQTDTSSYSILKKYLFAQPVKPTLYSTGLYAIAGQPVYLTLPSSLQVKGMYLFIGSQSDFLGTGDADNQDWRRMPGVTTGYEINNSFQFASSPFGGLIYLALFPDAPSVDAEIRFRNVITTPFFKLGVTTLIDWKKQLTNNKAPWGEIASDKIIITLPDSALQKIEDPEKLLSIWDKIVSAESELAGLPSPFIRPMRFVVDEHISAGYMHSGYPIMIHHSPSTGALSLDVIINPEKLLEPSQGGANWGFFHEIGHNLQNREWVFDGSTEVGCNFFSLYVFDSLIKSREGAHRNISKDYQEKLMQDYFVKETSYAVYQQDPFLALIPFMQLQKHFGWDVFKKVLKRYNSPTPVDIHLLVDNESDYTNANLLRIDRLVTYFSFETKTNLAPFFRKWGLPVSTNIESELTKYTVWLPEDLKRFQ